LKKIISLVLMLVLTLSFAFPVFGQDPFSITYLYGGSNESYLTQLKPLQTELDTVLPDYFNIDGSGNLAVNVSGDFVKQAQQMGFMVVPFVSNHFNKTAGHLALLQQDKLVNTILQAVKKYRLDGINLDVENIPVEDKQLFNQFVNKLAANLHELGKTLSIALPATETFPGVGWVSAYDYQTLANTADFIIVMTYDQHWENPGPVAGLPWVENVLKTVLQIVPSEKLVLGLPFYGRWWINGRRYKEVNHEGALTVASNYMEQPKWDNKAQAPYLEFADAAGNYHQLWYENAFSLGAKLGLIKKYQLAGAASWRLGLEDPDFWGTYQRFLLSMDNEKRGEPANRGDNRTGVDAFADTAGHWAAVSINYLHQKGLINGYEDNTFRPEASITRAEVTAVLTRWLKLPPGEARSYHDVSRKYWAYDAIMTASANGLVGGYKDNTFRPEKSITRAELTALLSRVFSRPGKPGSGFTDVKPGHWAYDAIISMQGQGLINGYDDGSFRPEAPVTRAEFSAMLARIITKSLKKI